MQSALACLRSRQDGQEKREILEEMSLAGVVCCGQKSGKGMEEAV